jgi:hypothetical protein
VTARRLALALSAFALAYAAATPGSASADDAGAAPRPAAAAPAPLPHSAIAEIVVIHATKEDGAAFVDPRIGRLPHLGKKPFSDYTSFKLVDKKVLTLEKGRAESYAMVTLRTLRVALENVTPDRRYVVEASIDQPGKAEYLKLLEVTAAPNEPFFVGGQSYKGGTLILSITMRPDVAR